MHLKSSANRVSFVKQVKKCKGKVLLTTPQGDCLNLQSALCQLIFALSAEKRAFLGNAEVVCDENEDYELLQDYLE